MTQRIVLRFPVPPVPAIEFSERPFQRCQLIVKRAAPMFPDRTVRDVRTTGLHVVILVAARLFVTYFVWALGFEALSDDDYARVVLAQTFAHAPKLDPTGTSWLPFPFWLNGAWMAVFGRTLRVARALAVLLACVSGVLIYSAARMGRVPPKAACLGVLAWTFSPVGVYVGAATVPEISTAALCASALLLLRRDDARVHLLAAFLLLPATLSRYEAWPVAVFMILSIGIRSVGDIRRRSSWRKIGTCTAAMAVASLGPISWIAWNFWSHGDAFHFHERVSAYWFAWDGSADQSWESLLTYPKTVVIDAPVFVVSLVGAAYWTTQPRRLRTWVYPVVGALFLVASLTLAQGTGGAPTHHPERTLLAVWAVGWMAAADLLVGKGARQGVGWTRWRYIWLASVLTFALIRTNSVASWYGVHRAKEQLIGAWLRSYEGRVLLAPKDYGYFAMVAAMGQPERVQLGGSVDPRFMHQPSPFDTQEALRARIAGGGFRWVVASEQQAQGARQMGSVKYSQGSWIVVEAK